MEATKFFRINALMIKKNFLNYDYNIRHF